MDKYVYQNLAMHGNANGGNIYPGIKLLAENMLISERTVKYSIKRLVAAGYLKEAGYDGHKKRYEIPITEIWTDAQIAPNKGKSKKTTLVPAPPPDDGPTPDEEIPTWRPDETPEERAAYQRATHERIEETMRAAQKPARSRTPADEERLRKAGFPI